MIERSRRVLSPFLRRVEGGFELRLKVVPGSSPSELAGILGDRLKVRVAAVAERGRANEAVVRLLCEWLEVSDVEIVAGHAYPEKTVRVRGLEALDERQLDALVRGGRERVNGR